MATLREQRQQAEQARAAEVERGRREAQQRLHAEAERAGRQFGLVQQVLLDRATARAAAGLDGLAAVVWSRDGTANVNGHLAEGQQGQLALVPAGVAQVLADAGAAVVREPLQLPPWQKPEAAGWLRAAAAELLEAADDLDRRPADPAAQPQDV